MSSAWNSPCETGCSLTATYDSGGRVTLPAHSITRLSGRKARRRPLPDTVWNGTRRQPSSSPGISAATASLSATMTGAPENGSVRLFPVSTLAVKTARLPARVTVTRHSSAFGSSLPVSRWNRRTAPYASTDATRKTSGETLK